MTGSILSRLIETENVTGASEISSRGGWNAGWQDLYKCSEREEILCRELDSGTEKFYQSFDAVTSLFAWSTVHPVASRICERHNCEVRVGLSKLFEIR